MRNLLGRRVTFTLTDETTSAYTELEGSPNLRELLHALRLEAELEAAEGNEVPGFEGKDALMVFSKDDCRA